MVAATQMLTIAQAYTARGWRVIPVPFKQKAPVAPEWQNLNLSERDLAQHFGNGPTNIGALLGKPSGNLIDVDLDCPEAIVIARLLLPDTGSVFGRNSAPCSHWLYVSKCETRKFSEPGRKGQMLVEIRSTGGQTVFPGSVHVSGEVIEWDADNGPTFVAPETLYRRVEIVALSALLARQWPSGRRHEAALGLAGWLAKGGWTQEQTQCVVEAIAKAADDDELSDRVAAVSSTYVRKEAGEPIQGYQLLRELFDEPVLSYVAKWGRLDVPREPTEKPEAPKRSRSRVAPPDQIVDMFESLDAWKGVIVSNEMHAGRPSKRRAPPFAQGAEGWWTDDDTVATRVWLARKFPQMSFPAQNVIDAVTETARTHPFHPVRDHLARLRWDGVGRIEGWLITYLGAEESEYHCIVGRKFLIAAVARVMSPGCKVDTILVLEGDQGTGKSTALKIIADPWFLDSPIDIQSKDAHGLIQGWWIIELAELEGLRKVDTTRLKQFFAQTEDTFRPPYARLPVTLPRQCVFAATTNHSNYLRDETGHRRFWPVECGTIDLEGLRQDRDQLLAEAMVAYHEGGAWWPEKGDLDGMREAQKAREEEDVWETSIAMYVLGRESVGVTIDELLEHAIDIKEIGRRGRSEQTRVGTALRKMGWKARGKARPRRYFHDG